jgi:xanthine dehydrogenase accessory factor
MRPNEEDKSSRVITEAIRMVLASGQPAVLATLIAAGANVGAKLLVTGSGNRKGSFGDSSLDETLTIFAMRFFSSRDETRVFRVQEIAPHYPEAEARVLFELIRPEPRIVICGAGHVGASLARLASLLGYAAILVDDRPEFVTREQFPDERIELIAARSWREALITAIGNGGGVAVAIVTRGHKEDEECLRAVLTSHPDYIGLIGSKRRTNIVLNRLLTEGADEEMVRSVRAPIGLDIGAVTPEEVALAILAEIVAERRGGKGGALSGWRRKS